VNLCRPFAEVGSHAHATPTRFICRCNTSALWKQVVARRQILGRYSVLCSTILNRAAKKGHFTMFLKYFFWIYSKVRNEMREADDMQRVGFCGHSNFVERFLYDLLTYPAPTSASSEQKWPRDGTNQSAYTVANHVMWHIPRLHSTDTPGSCYPRDAIRFRQMQRLSVVL
jgi:hypothetical protein